MLASKHGSLQSNEKKKGKKRKEAFEKFKKPPSRTVLQRNTHKRNSSKENKLPIFHSEGSTLFLA